MRPLLATTVTLLVLACAGGGSDGKSDDDSAVPFEGDDAGECADGADNDRDGAFDCDDPACAASPDCAEGDSDTDADADTDTDTDADTDTDTTPQDVVWTGDVEGELFMSDTGGRAEVCTGTFTLTMPSGGQAVTGEASCDWNSSSGVTGTVEGTVDGTTFTGVWHAQLSWETYDIDLHGQASVGTFHASFDEGSGAGRFKGTFDGS